MQKLAFHSSGQKPTETVGYGFAHFTDKEKKLRTGMVAWALTSDSLLPCLAALHILRASSTGILRS